MIFFRSVPIAKPKQQLQGIMWKFYVIFAVLSAVIGAIAEDPEDTTSNKHKILCDLNSFMCKCGDIDVVSCKCIDWSRDCPENYTYDKNNCGCKEGTGSGVVGRTQSHQDNDSEIPKNPSNQAQTGAFSSLSQDYSSESITIDPNTEPSYTIKLKARKPIEIMKEHEKATTRAADLLSSYVRPSEYSKTESESSTINQESNSESQESIKSPDPIKERLEILESTPNSSVGDHNVETNHLSDIDPELFPDDVPMVHLVHGKPDITTDNSYDASDSSNSAGVHLDSISELMISDPKDIRSEYKDTDDAISSESHLQTSSINKIYRRSTHGLIEMPSHYGSHTIHKKKHESSSLSVDSSMEVQASDGDSYSSSKMSASLEYYSSEVSRSYLPSSYISSVDMNINSSSDPNETPSDRDQTLSKPDSTLLDPDFTETYILSSTNTITLISTSPSDSCFIPECRPCDELDEINCICYQVEMECLPGYTTSADGCECVRDNTTSISDVCPGLICTDGLSINEASCNCSHKICASAQACDDKFLLDLETCECVCGLREWNCQKSFIINQEKCQCEPPPCTPRFPCPESTKWDFDACTCVCSNPPNCTSDKYVVDPYSCKCVCANQDCDVGYIVDQLTCECVPDHEPECPAKFVYDPMLCRCICQAYNECPFNFQWDESLCKCVCPKSVICGDDFIWSDQHCDCICNANKTCQPSFVFDSKKCDCVCDPKLNDDVCEVGHIFDKRICDCVKGARPQCPAGFVYSEEQCDCVCAVVEKCTGKGIFDHDTCKCVCLEEQIECDFGIFEKEECDCVSGLPIDFFGGNFDED
ncbi:hypothetical protein ACKWTF_015853 [Chironomus riparius]